MPSVPHRLFDDTDKRTAKAYFAMVAQMSLEHKARKFAEINHLAKVALRERLRRERGPMSSVEESIAIAEEMLAKPLRSQFIAAIRKRAAEASTR